MNKRINTLTVASYGLSGWDPATILACDYITTLYRSLRTRETNHSVMLVYIVRGEVLS